MPDLRQPPHQSIAPSIVTSEEAVQRLQSLGGDSESAHSEADRILLEFLTCQEFVVVSNAWEKARSDIGFWYG